MFDEKVREDRRGRGGASTFYSCNQPMDYREMASVSFKGIVGHFGKLAYSLFGKELDEKIYFIHLFVY